MKAWLTLGPGWSLWSIRPKLSSGTVRFCHWLAVLTMVVILCTKDRVSECESYMAIPWIYTLTIVFDYREGNKQNKHSTKCTGNISPSCDRFGWRKVSVFHESPKIDERSHRWHECSKTGIFQVLFCCLPSIVYIGFCEHITSKREYVICKFR